MTALYIWVCLLFFSHVNFQILFAKSPFLENVRNTTKEEILIDMRSDYEVAFLCLLPRHLLCLENSELEGR